MTHSLYSPSSLHRRISCLGSANAERDMPDTSSEVSAEGTAAHHIREQCLLTGKNVDDFVGTTVDIEGFSFEVTQEWVRFLQPGIDHLRDLGTVGSNLHIESFVDLYTWMPGEGGTLDAGVITPELITINDLKFGRSPVSAERNPQLMAYALGYIESIAFLPEAEINDTKVALEIDQPRVFGGGSRWVTTVGELWEFGDQLREMYQLSQDPNAPRTPSFDACTYCKANTQCRELADYIFDILGISFEGGKMIQSDEQLDNDKLAVIVSNASLITKMIEAYKSHAKDLILSEGVDLQGVKVVAGAGRREWVNAEDVEAWLLTKYKKHQIYKSELISPAQAENVLGTRNWAKVQTFIRTSEGNPTLVSADDPRPALIPAVNLFDVVDDDIDLLFDEVSYDLDDILG